MENFRNLIEGICTLGVKEDKLLKAFGGLCGEQADCCRAYSEICFALLSENKTLGGYLRELALYSDSPFLARCAKEPSALQKKAVECDLGALARIAEYSSERLKGELSERFGGADFSRLPDYERGEFTLTADDLLDFAAKHGSGIFARYRAFTFKNGELLPVEKIDPIRLRDLKSYEAQRNQVVENTLRFIGGKPAQNTLLYGDRGTGKSSTVKAILNEYEPLRMVELTKSDVEELPALYRRLGNVPLYFIVMIDDLTFAENDERFGILKAALEGSLSARPRNILIYATTNRRKIIKESAAEREISGADAIDESMSLADRFGLFVTFGRPGREVYLDIVKQLADECGVKLGTEELFAAAERFALLRGGRSPRTARQFVDSLMDRL